MESIGHWGILYYVRSNNGHEHKSEAYAVMIGHAQLWVIALRLIEEFLTC